MTRDDVEVRSGFDHRPSLDRLSDESGAGRLDGLPVEMADGIHLGGGVHHHHPVGIRVLGGGGREHGGEAGLTGEAEADGGVALRLIDDHDEGPRGIGVAKQGGEVGATGIVVEAEPRLPQEGDARLGAGEDVVILPTAFLQHRLQFARGRGVVMDAESIHDRT